MARRLSLPLSDELSGADALPTLEAMRKRLGGRVASALAIVTPRGPLVVGSFADFTTSDSGARKSGVVLSVDGDAVDVYMTGGLVRRMRAEFLSPSEVLPALASIAESAAVFARLGEGQDVEVERGEGELQRGTLLEKCRYGALVRLAEGVVLAVGFRRVWPVREPGVTN